MLKEIKERATSATGYPIKFSLSEIVESQLTQSSYSTEKLILFSLGLLGKLMLHLIPLSVLQ
jgi:hypothetical protein